MLCIPRILVARLRKVVDTTHILFTFERDGLLEISEDNILPPLKI